MGTVHEGIDGPLATWLQAQHVVFVATAPLAADGRVNVSPKGMAGTFRVLDPHRVAYLDYHGSGVETIAHLRENGRICVMFTAFEQRPRIVRLHGRGSVVLPGEALFDDVLSAHPGLPAGARAVIVVDIHRIADSCGWGVPRMELVDGGERGIMGPWADKKGPDGLAAYRRQKNTQSLDGLPALDPA